MDDHETPINGGPGRLEWLRWPFERLAWIVQRGLIWPLQDRLDLLSPPARALAAFSTVVAAVAAVAIGVGVGGSGGSPSEPASTLAAEPAPVVAAAPAAEPEKQEPEPTLEGAAPVFEPARSKSAPKQKPAAEQQAEEPAEEAAAASASSSAATDTISSSPAASSSAARSSASAERDGPPAGGKALAVAREFADAFVVYETGGEKSAVRRAFRATATEELAQTLLRRPPRLPANVEVPKAKVVNVVAGPSHGGAYPVSVSLLRVGLTSELRLELERLKKQSWRVTNVLG